MNDKINPTRKSCPPIKVYCLPSERATIQAEARKAGMSASAYLLSVGQRYYIESITDYERVQELTRINGDLGRLGGLLKLWLTNDERTAQFSDATMRAILSKIADTQDEMVKVMRAIVRPGSDA